MDPYLLQKNHAIDTVSELFVKYQDDPYMSAKLHNHVCIQLSSIMDNIKKNRDERQQRIADLTVEQDEFMERFLHTHRYFYVSTTETFVSYDGTRYELTTEDNILHHILTTITSEKQLMDWKQRTKVYIMKRIKDSPLLKSVPESETIQNVLSHFYPSLFETKQEAKYFLTIIGDSLFRKNSDLIYFIQPRAKAFLREIANISILLFGVNSTHTFKYKFYDHNYSQCRLVKINDAVNNEKIWGQLLQNISIDMLCVAAHYSIRYGSADEYLSRFSNQPFLETYAFFLRNTTPEQLVDRFIAEYLQVSLNGTFITHSPSATSQLPTPPNASNLLISLSSFHSTNGNIYSQSPDTTNHTNTIARCNPPIRDTTTRQISWKNMQYLWRNFLENQQLPTVIFQQNLKAILTQKLSENYKEDTDNFIGVSSRFMPCIRTFIFFWETTVTYDESCEYEIDELCMLYKRWLSMPYNSLHSTTQTPTEPGQLLPINTQLVKPTAKPDVYNSGGVRDWGVGALTEKQMLDLIMYYFPNIEIDKDKYVYNIRSALWDKQMDVQTALSQLRETLRTTQESAEHSHIYATTVYDAYVWYCKYYSDMYTDDRTVFAEPTEGTLAIAERKKPKSSNKQPVVSKSYFEKYISEILCDYVVDNKYILREWLYADTV
jgi:hypothetical protein